MHRDLLTAADQADPAAPVRYAASPEFTVPLGDIRTSTPDLLLTTGHGLLGHTSPLPLALADDLADDPPPLLADLHHQRMTALVAGLRAADLARDLDATAATAAWPRRISALAGLHHLSSGTDPTLPLRLAPIFAAPDRTLRSLGLAVHRLLGRTGPAPALRLEHRPGVLTPLDKAQHTRLGAPAARLGLTAALGTAIPLPSAAARLHLGRIPPDTSLPLLRALVDLFLPEPAALELVVDRPPPPPILGHHRL